MLTFHKLDDVPRDFGPALVSVGNFDGVHRAHRHVLDEIVRRAKAANAQSVVVTFEPHPARILRPDQNLKLLTPLPEKLRLLEATGIDAVMLLAFSRDLSLMTPHQFAHEILKKRLHAREVHEGYNFHFGHKAAGNIEALRHLGREMGFEVHDYPEMRLRGENVSSSHIRKLISEGRVSRARHLLGRAFSILSTAGRGRGYGAKYTVPTINLAHYEELVPKDGVYITRTRIGQECFDSVTNVGNRPTFGADSFAIETHLLNFHPIELSAETEVEIHFLDRLRDEIKFPSVEALKEQIGRDVRKAQRYLGRLGRAGIPPRELMQSDAVNKKTREEWRELGFFYDRDDDAKVWKFIGSRKGLLSFPDMLRAYVADPRNALESEHEHYGPYMYLKVMTWPEAGFDNNAIRGPLADLARLAALVDAELAAAQPGSAVHIRDEFAADSPYSLVLEVREDSFDPATADPLLPTEKAG